MTNILCIWRIDKKGIIAQTVCWFPCNYLQPSDPIPIIIIVALVELCERNFAKTSTINFIAREEFEL